MKYLVAYDVTNNKNRKKLGELFEEFGTRVNYSVFEIELNKTKINKLLEQIREQKLYNKKQDSIRFYYICQNCEMKSFELCNRPGIFEGVELFI